MNVLSLFDGISCGQIALERVGIKVDNYYASEIDRYAIQVTKNNYPNTIHIGDVQGVKSILLPKIDLLMGGSPCQGFSSAGKQLNFDDPRSKLFFDFVRLLKDCKPKYFLLENVRMKQEYQDIISEYLGVQPIMINSSLVSAQNRVRYYWTNIPNVVQPEDKGITIKDILEDEPVYIDKSYYIENRKITGKNALNKLRLSERDVNGKFRCLTAGGQDGTKAGATTIRLDNGRLRLPTPIECERAQTVPENYTSCVSKTQRYKALGNGWTVDIITHILKNIL